MQTRCLSCGKLIDGVAQFCDDCRARDEALPDPAIESTPSLRRDAGAWRAAESKRQRSTAFAVIGAVIVVAAVLLLAFVGLNSLGGDDSAPAAVLGTGSPTPGASLAALGYEKSACTFDQPEDATAECGYLTVPISHAEPDRGRVRLPVAVFKSDSADRRPDPLIYLDGGPGGNTLSGARFVYEALAPIAANRDLILFDQRGAGGSHPSLNCPEVTDVNYAQLLRQFTIDERVAQDVASVRRCRERLAGQGIDPSFATSAESAADVNDLRIALGYEKLNLYGVSYGTKLALTVMRDFPDAVRSAVLDSTYPLQADLYAEVQADFDRALNALFASCAADDFCGAEFPNLDQAFYETVDRLNRIPVQVSLGALTGRSASGPATIDGVWFSTFIFQALYSEDAIAVIPQFIFDTRDREYGAMEVLADLFFRDIESISYGMHLSVQCGEEVPFTDRNAVITAAEAHAHLRDYSVYNARSLFASCDEWQAPAASPNANEAVSSTVPTLVLAGEFDPITPPAWGRMVADSLENSYFFEFHDIGHGVAFSDECPAGMATAFLDDPASQPASGCIARMDGVDWLAY
jgi:pimeloyl-ACP methyl ester carboxylesterase